MNSRTLVTLLVSLAVLVALAVAVSVSQRPAATTGGPFLPELRERLNDVSRIVVRAGGNRTVATLERKEDGWALAERDGFAADLGRIRRNLIALSESRILEEKTSNPELYNRLQVDDIEKENAGGVRLDISAGDNTTSVIIGTAGVGGGERAYARRAGEPTSWLVSGSLDLPRETADWLDRVIVDVAADRVQAVTISHPAGPPVKISRDSAEVADFAVLDLPAGRKLSFPGAGNAIGGALKELMLDSVEPATAFDPGPVKPVVARFQTFDGLVVEVSSYRLPAGVRMRISASADAGQAERFAAKPAEKPEAGGKDGPPAPVFAQVEAEAARIRARGAGWVYTVPDFKAEQLTRRLEDLLESTAVGPPRPL